MSDREVLKRIPVGEGPTAVQITSIDLYSDRSHTEQFSDVGRYELVRITSEDE